MRAAAIRGAPWTHAGEYCSRDATAHRASRTSTPVATSRAVLAFAHRGGALPPRHRRPREHPGRLRARRRRSATATSRPTCTPPATACCWPSTTRSLDRVTDQRRAPSPSLAYDDLARGPDRRPRADPDAGRPARAVPRRPVQHRPQVRRRGRRPLADLVERTGAHDRVCVGSFSERRLRAFRRRVVAGRSPPSYGPIGVALGRFAAAAAGARRCSRGRGDALQVPHRPRALRRRHRGLRRPGARRRAARCTCGPSTTRPRCDELLDLGVDGLITDRTDVLRDVLRRARAVEGARR